MFRDCRLPLQTSDMTSIDFAQDLGFKIRERQNVRSLNDRTKFNTAGKVRPLARASEERHGGLSG